MTTTRRAAFLSDGVTPFQREMYERMSEHERQSFQSWLLGREEYQDAVAETARVKTENRARWLALKPAYVAARESGDRDTVDELDDVQHEISLANNAAVRYEEEVRERLFWQWRRRGR